MTTDAPVRRLLIAVEPRLLGDALARVLDAEYDVVVVDPSTPPPADANPLHFDAAVVSGEQVPTGTSVELLLRLPTGNTGTGLGTLRSDAGERRVAVGGLAAIADVLRDGVEPAGVGERG